MIITGNGSNWNATSTYSNLLIGYDGNGTLQIANGGRMTNTSIVSIGTRATGVGLATIDGATSSFTTNGNFIVGEGGSGELRLANGGRVVAPRILVAYSAGSNGSISLSNSTIETGEIYEGSSLGSGTGSIVCDGGVILVPLDQGRLFENFESGDIQVQGSGLSIDTNGYMTYVLSPLAGTGELIKLGEGLLVLDLPSELSGNTIIEAGSLSVTSLASDVAPGSHGSGNVLIRNGTLQYAGSGSTTNRLQIQAPSSGIEVLKQGAILNLPDAVPSTHGAGLSKYGLGTLQLGGANGYTGQTSIQAGTLILDYSQNDSSKLSDSASLELYGGTLLLSGNNASHHEIVGSTSVLGETVIARQGSTGAKLQLGNISRMGPGRLDIGNEGIASTTSPLVNGVLDGVTILGGLPATKDAEGNIVPFQDFDDVTRLESGKKVVSGGSIHVRISDGSGSSPTPIFMENQGVTNIGSMVHTASGGQSTVTIGTNNTLRFGNLGVVTSTSGASDLLIDGGDLTAQPTGHPSAEIAFICNSNNPTTITSRIVDDAGTFASLTKSGTGSLILSGSNSYSGATNINKGTLVLGSANALGSSGLRGTPETMINFRGGELKYTPANTLDYSARFSTTPKQHYTVDTNGQFVTWGSPLNSSNSQLIKKGGGTLALSSGGSECYPPEIIVDAGTLKLTAFGWGADRMRGNGQVTVNAGGTLDIDHAHALGSSGSNMTERLTVNGGIVNLNREQYFKLLDLNAATINGAYDIRTSVGAVWRVGGNFKTTINPTFTINFDADVIVDDVTKSPASDIDILGSRNGPARLIKRGLGTMTFLGNTTHTGEIIVSEGTLQVGNGDVSGALGTGALTNNSVLHFNRGGSLTVSCTISGTGTLLKSGLGNVILTATNTYSGETIVTGGTLSLSQPSLADTSRVKLTTGGILNLSHTSIDSIQELQINGVPQACGTWGAIGSGAMHETSLLSGPGKILVTSGPKSEYYSWASMIHGLNDANARFSSDPDKDGVPNILEFALSGVPDTIDPANLQFSKVQSIEGSDYLTLTFAARSGALFQPEGPSQTALVDDVTYRVEGASDLQDWHSGVTVSEVIPALPGSLPPAPSGWDYHTFKVVGGALSNPRRFIRVKVSAQ